MDAWPVPRALPVQDEVLVTEEEALIFRQAREALWRIAERSEQLAFSSRTANARPDAHDLGHVAESASAASDSILRFLSAAKFLGREKNVDLGIDREGA